MSRGRNSFEKVWPGSFSIWGFFWARFATLRVQQPNPAFPLRCLCWAFQECRTGNIGRRPGFEIRACSRRFLIRVCDWEPMVACFLMEPRTRFELVTLAFLWFYQGNALGWSCIYQAEPPGHRTQGEISDLIKLSRATIPNIKSDLF